MSYNKVYRIFLIALSLKRGLCICSSQLSSCELIESGVRSEGGFLGMAGSCKMPSMVLVFSMPCSDGNGVRLNADDPKRSFAAR